MNYISISVFAMGVIFFVAAVLVTKAPKIRHVFCVPEGFAGLLYHDGLYVRRHNAGCNVIWGLGWAMTLVDIRRALMPVEAEEALTADNVSLKFSLLMTYEVDDPITAAHATQDWRADLQNAAQVALRAIVSEVTIETLLNRWTGIGARVLSQVQSRAVRIGINVIAIEVKDMTLPADVRQAFANALKAKQEGQALQILSVDCGADGA